MSMKFFIDYEESKPYIIKELLLTSEETMSRTGFVYHEDFLKHEMGAWHPENPARLTAIVEHLKKINLLPQLTAIEPYESPLEWISTIHAAEYISFVKGACLSGGAQLDPDTSVNKESYRVALLAAGGLLAAVDAIMNDKIDNAFCAVRPPGHHAEYNRAMGFCLFNNIAIAAKYIQQHYHLKKVLIVDWDVHHGNGTQNSFYEDATVFYFSVHQWPHYPGTGLANERGSGAGDGFTLNKPLSSGADDATYLKIFKEELVPIATNFKPGFVLISAGFDAHQNDPLAGMNLSTDGFAALTSIIKQIAVDLCQGRLISTLEGGYNLEALAQSVEVHLNVLMQ